jgi:hypothetical protein
VHAFVTIKNPSGAERKIVLPTLKSFLEDVDGVTFTFDGIRRATTPEPEPFNIEPVLPAGGELQARFVMNTLKGGAPLRSLMVKEGAATASFDLSGVTFPGQIAQPFTGAPGAVSEWKELGSFDVRFDGARPQRGAKFSEAFFTFRNLSEEMQQVFFVGGTFRLTTTGP